MCLHIVQNSLQLQVHVGFVSSTAPGSAPEPHWETDRSSEPRRLVNDINAGPIEATLLQAYETRNKKFKMMLTRRAKAYSSSCLQTVSLELEPFRCSSFLECALQLNIAKKSIKSLILEIQGFSKSSMLIRLKNLSCCDSPCLYCLLYTSPSPRD